MVSIWVYFYLFNKKIFLLWELCNFRIPLFCHSNQLGLVTKKTVEKTKSFNLDEAMKRIIRNLV